jgi:transcriptional regulator with XRE-family HTH domain
MQLENLVIGRNIAKYRKMKDLKALDVASQLGMKEAAYTKYERGETAITIDFVQKVATVLEANPLHLLSASPGNFLESITNSQIAIQENSTFHTTNDEQTKMMLKLMESVVTMNERILNLLEKKD